MEGKEPQKLQKPNNYFYFLKISGCSLIKPAPHRHRQCWNPQIVMLTAVTVGIAVKYLILLVCSSQSHESLVASAPVVKQMKQFKGQ